MAESYPMAVPAFLLGLRQAFLGAIRLANAAAALSATRLSRNSAGNLR
jgi:hypothetical protein